MRNPFKYFKTSPEIIRLAVMMYIRYPLSLSNVEDMLHERGIDITHETVRFWWNRFGPMFAAQQRRSGRSEFKVRATQTEASRVFRRLQFVRRSYDERYKEQIFA